ncbi:DUF1684 domain-containing protein [Herbidospora sp. NEAU-GS84]|uniref:DUF1684 domain-containing protein n=1 Tax=Herbidospora solisilvae TaxID=2696284 RepID=A0A7C9NML3_9ACTN|nr:DUF1684 domain-containing protein [Herbidospora solisilvae]NAS22256.1 DUF1684 domain-containing protein [Herbidospora solisilvae]
MTTREDEVRDLLTLTGTTWIDGETVVPGVPGVWSPTGGGVELKAGLDDGLTIDGEPVTGPVVITPDVPALYFGRVRIQLVIRDGLPAIRTWDPDAETLRAFTGIESYPHDPAWIRPAVFRPYGETRPETVLTADGRDRDLLLVGEVVVDLPGGSRTLAVTEAPGGLSAHFGDLTNGDETFRFRTLPLPAPGPDGTLEADFNRAHLPPCALTDHFLCFFPPPGNRLDVRVTAGEKRIV